MDSQDIIQDYIRREMHKKPVEMSHEEINARNLIAKVYDGKGETLVEKAKSVGIDYQDFMDAQRLVGKRY